MKKLETLLKKVLIWCIASATLVMGFIQYLPLTELNADSYNMLGTSAALGSPILNNNFTSDNWNKWETIAWGVYLSNFCQPFVDNYNSAFSSGAGGSEGSGYNALTFGSGNDPTNNDVIREFTKFASEQQSGASREIYVGFSKVDSTGKVVEQFQPSDVTSDQTGLRVATVADLFITKWDDKKADIGEENLPNAEIKNNTAYDGLSSRASYGSLADAIITSELYLPTFYVKNDAGGWAKVLDYTSVIDLQCFSSVVNVLSDYSSTAKITDAQKAQATSKEATEFYKAGKNATLQLDCFGNLVTNYGTSNSAAGNVVVFPSACNPNIRNDHAVNLLNSWMINGLTQARSSDDLVLNIASDADGNAGSWWSNLIEIGSTKVGNLPAIGGTKAFSNMGLLYFDSATIKSEYTSGANHGGAGYSSYNYGGMLSEMFKQDIKNETYTMPLLFSTTGGMKGDIDDNDFIGTTSLVASMLAGTLENQTYLSVDTMLNQLVNTDGTKIELFGNPVAIAVDVSPKSAVKGSQAEQASAVRSFYNWLYNVYNRGSKSTAGELSSSTVKQLLSNSGDWEQFKSKVGTNSNIWKSFIADYPQYKDAFKVSNNNSFLDWGDNNTINDETNRVIVAFPGTKELTACGAVLGLQTGTEMRTYSTMIYMTYLDWYGVSNKTTFSSGTESSSKFNPDLFESTNSALTDDVSSISKNTMSVDQMNDKIRNLSYLMLSPDQDGKEYRNSILMSSFAEWMYEQYERICYGGSRVSKSYATRSDTGFLHLPTYDENMLTSVVLQYYPKIAVVLIGVCSILLLIVGLLKSKFKLSWWFFGFVTIVTIVLLVPSVGDLTPVVATSIINKMYSPKMTYWSLTEQITNATNEANAMSKKNEFNGLSDEETATVMKVINNLQSLDADNSLMLEQDISQKLTQQLGGVYTEMQSLPSTRWLLPMVMQQYNISSSDPTESKGVYLSMSNVMTDASNMYWYYNPEDASFVTKPTLTSGQFAGKATTTTSSEDSSEVYNTGTVDIQAKDFESYDSRTQTFMDYKDPTWADDGTTDINYANYSYTLHQSDDQMDEMVHLYSFLDMEENTRVLPSRQEAFGGDTAESWTENYEDADSWSKYISTAGLSVQSNIDNWNTTDESQGFDNVANTYDRSNASSIKPGFSYYKNTESPVYYFFNVVKDSFPSMNKIGSIIGSLQGTVEDAVDEKGNPIRVRNNFMYATKTSGREMANQTGMYCTNEDVEYTGYVRDILDFQNFFTNVVPYLYQTTLATGGFSGVDGNSGLAGLEISSASDYYAGSPQSWAYRCNWAVKLMENPKYSKPAKVYSIDENGNRVRHVVANPIMPSSYPEERPMVFSEAQMKAQGISRNELNLVELKCLEVNEQTAKSWTMLINYAGTDGITKEALFRQMALDATMNFTREFSNTDYMNTKYGLSPQSLDLRYLSIDSIIRLLMINATRNSAYTQGGSVMKTLIFESDMVSSTLLLGVAFMCATVIPFLQHLFLGLIFYMGFFSIMRSLLQTRTYKVKIACGTMISNVVFVVLAMVYYGIIAIMSNITVVDEVLSVGYIKSEGHSPAWVLIVLLVLSCVYAFVISIFLVFCVKNIRDMGFEAYSSAANTVAGKIAGGLALAGGTLLGAMGLESFEESNRVAAGRKGHDAAEGGKVRGKTKESVSTASEKSKTTVETASNTEDIENGESHARATSQADRDSSGGSSESIDAEISKGHKIVTEESSKTVDTVIEAPKK